MDTVTTYHPIIERVLTNYAQIPYAYGDIQVQAVFDREADHYLLMLVGRDGIRRVRQRIAEIIELADQATLDIMRSRAVEQEVLELLDEPATR